MATTMDDTFAAVLDTDEEVVVRNMNSRTLSDPCACCNCMVGRNMLRGKQDLAGDLASQLFGHLVSTEVAKLILTAFVNDGFVQVFEGTISHNEEPPEAPLDPDSEDVQRALAQALKATKAHDCIRLHPGENAPAESVPSADQDTMEEKIYSFRWRLYPQKPFRSAGLVPFLNEVTDRALAAAKSHLASTKLNARHRFAAPDDKDRFVALTYHPGLEEVPPPEFVLLPIQAFSGEGFKTVDKRYINYSAARLVGESNDDVDMGLDQMQWFAEGLKHAQPWIFYVLAMMFSLPEDLLVFSRADPSGWEHLVLMLWDGRGCIEFIRILLGLVLADDLVLGQNPFVQLMCAERTFKLDPPESHRGDSESDADSEDGMSDTSNSCSSESDSAEKRCHSDIEMEDDEIEDPRSKKHKVAVSI